MSCPFFEPLERLQEATARMPLGDVWRGVCRTEAAPITPDDSAVRELCNMGYARGRCPRYAQADAGDAVRFLIAGDRDQLIRIEYVVERDHHPYTHGAVKYDRMRGAFADEAADTIINRQALAYVKSYLIRRPVVA